MKDNTSAWLTVLQAGLFILNLSLAVANPTPVTISCAAIVGGCFFYSLYRFPVFR